ncbi:MAG: FlgD immunoglobulin-like domain containing protein [Candidatus Wallbacteria bacterium]
MSLINLKNNKIWGVLSALIMIFSFYGMALASGAAPQTPAIVGPANDTYYKSTLDVELQWQMPSDPENDTLEMKVVFDGPKAMTAAAPASISNAAAGASSEVLIAMFTPSSPFSIQNNSPAVGSVISFKIQSGFPIPIPEGKWFWSVYANDKTSYSAAGVVRSFIVDATAPAVSSLSVSNNMFSPTSPTKSTTAISYMLSDNLAPNVNVTIDVIDSLNNVVRVIENNVNHVISGSAQTAVWDGKKTDTTNAEDGVYTIRVTATDLAGNVSATATKNVTVVSNSPIITLGTPVLTNNPFAPSTLSSSTKKTTTLSYSIDSESSVEIKICSGNAWNDAALIKTLEPKANKAAGAYTKIWDGTNNTSTVVSDGVYTIRIISTNLTGFSSTVDINVTVDNVAADITPYGVSPSPFSPNVPPGTTTISYALNEQATVEINVKNTSGIIIKQLQPPTVMAIATIPQHTITWDGRDAGNSIVADGAYIFEIKTEDLAGNTKSYTGNIVIDKTGPIIAPYSVNPQAISPAVSSGVNDAATISYSISKSGTVEIKIYQQSGALIRNLLAPDLQTLGAHSVQWDGKDNTNTLVAEGIYRIEITLVDLAGNIGNPNPAVLNVTVDNTPPDITGLLVKPAVFASNNSLSTINSTTLKYSISESAEVTIKVLDSLDNLVKTIITSVPQTVGAHTAAWNGRDEADTPVEDGTYKFEIKAKDVAMNENTVTSTFKVDSTAPVINNLTAQPSPFAPASQNVNTRKTKIRYTLVDASGPCTTEVMVKTTLGAIVKTLISNTSIATGVLQEVQWDGTDTIGSIVEDGTYVASVKAADSAGNPSGETTAEISLQNRGPVVTAVKHKDNRNYTSNVTTIEVTFDRAVDDSTLVGLSGDQVISIIGNGTLGTGSRVYTGAVSNDNIIEIVLGADHNKFIENSDVIQLIANKVKSYPTEVYSTDVSSHLVLDGSPPYLKSSVFVDVGNDGINRGDKIIMTFNESVTAAVNNPSAVRIYPSGTIGSGAGLANGGKEQIIVVLGDVDTTSIKIKGKYGIDALASGINVVASQTSIIDNAGNYATPNLNVTGNPLAVDIGSNDTTGPKVVSAKYYDVNNNGLDAGDKIIVGFDKAVLVDPDPNPNTFNIFTLPVSDSTFGGNIDSFGAGSTFTYSGTKEVSVVLGTNPKITVKGLYLLGNNFNGSPSGIDISQVTAGEISDLSGNNATASLPVDIGSLDITAPKILAAKVTSNFGDNLINPTSTQLIITAIPDDSSLNTGDLTADLTSIGGSSKEVLTKGGGNVFQKALTLPAPPPYMTGAYNFVINAEDFSGNAASPYTFTAYVVEPAYELKAEVNPSSVPKRVDLSAAPEEFIVNILPKFQTQNKGFDTIVIDHPGVGSGNGYSFTSDTIDVFIGGVRVNTANYTETRIDPSLTITLNDNVKITPSTANPKITVKFKLNIPTASNSPTGSTFEVKISEKSFAAGFYQKAVNGDADGITNNNNTTRVVVSNVAIEDVKTKLDYSDFFWRINFEVKFNQELATSQAPTCSYQPTGTGTAVKEIPVQFMKFENKADTTDSNKIKAYFTGYVRVPIDNIDYLSDFTMFARNFYDTDGVQLAKVYKKSNSMATGFIISSFTSPLDGKDLLVTVLATTAVTPAFQLGLRQPGKLPVYKLKNELISHRQNLFTYKYRIDENYPGQIDVLVMEPGAAFSAPAVNAAIAKTGKSGSLKSAALKSGAAISSEPVYYSINTMASDLSTKMTMKSPDGLFEVSKDAEKLPGMKMFTISRQTAAYTENLSINDKLVKFGGIYQFSTDGSSFKNNFKIKLKADNDAIEYFSQTKSGVSGISADKVGIYQLVDGSWKYLKTEIESEGVYAVETNKPGIFGLFADMEKPEVIFNNVSGQIVKNNVALETKDSGSGIDLSSIKVVCDGKNYNITPSSAEEKNGMIVLYFNPESFKKAGIDASAKTNLSFEIADNSGNVARTQMILYQAAGQNDIYKSIIAYPNPAKRYTKIQYLINQNAEEVVLKIYDMNANLVYSSDMNSTMASNSPQAATWNLVNDDGERVANGTYFYKLKIKINGDTIEKTGKIAVLK